MSAVRAIDLFAGAGGFTTGAELAGVEVVWAANHWRESVEIHAANHPHVDHVVQDLHQADWAAVPEHELLLASPACQGHSQASQPRRLAKHQADRNTAWAVVSAAEVCRPRRILVENVPDFQRWALYPQWLSCLETLGYHVTEYVFDCADFGVPQNRRRAIVAGCLDGPVSLSSPELDHAPFEGCVDWAAPGWCPVSEKPAGVRRRIEAGRRRGLGRRFLTHYVTGHKGRSLERPIGTITTKCQWAVVDDDRTRMLNVAELRRGMAFPGSYVLPEGITLATRMLGNAIPPRFAAELVRQTIEG